MIHRVGWSALIVGLVLAVAIGVGLIEKHRAARRAALAQAERLAKPGDADQANKEVQQAGQPSPADDAEPDASSPAAAAADTGTPADAANPEAGSTHPQMAESQELGNEPTPAEPEVDQLIEMLAPSQSPHAGEALENRPQTDAAARDDPSGPTEATVYKLVPEPEVNWHEDYREAYREAAEDGRMLFIYFYDLSETPMRVWFEDQVLTDAGIKAKLAEYVLVRLPVDASISADGRSTALLEHAAFNEMQRRSGIAIIDLAHRNANYYKYVVSTFPFTRGRYYRGPVVSAILSLPPGTLTQRTMIYAVRTHPERPASTQGNFHNVLAEEAKLQSDYQAQILVQGHHNWDSRFHRINARLPNGATAQEVVAESWPNENLLDACVDCVDSWRQSPGHWSAVRSRHPLFGFDIKRGRNGIWYATGIFGRR